MINTHKCQNNAQEYHLNLISAILPPGSVRGSLDVRCLFGDDWLIDETQSPDPLMRYHILLSGHAQLQLADGQLRPVNSGDFVLLPAAQSHRLFSGNAGVTTPAIHTGAGGVTLVSGPGHPVAEVLCGRFYLPALASQLLRHALPGVLIVPTTANDQSQSGRQLRLLVELMHLEVQQQQAGSKHIIDQLANALFGYVARCVHQQPASAAGLLKLSQQPRLAPALQAMLNDPARPFSLPQLAALCFMSRATFVRQFQQAMGKSAAEFLLELRMLQAARLLEHSSESVDSIAEQCGYQSSAAFQRAFKKISGQTPAAWRHSSL